MGVLDPPRSRWGRNGSPPKSTPTVPLAVALLRTCRKRPRGRTLGGLHILAHTTAFAAGSPQWVITGEPDRYRGRAYVCCYPGSYRF